MTRSSLTVDFTNPTMSDNPYRPPQSSPRHDSPIPATPPEPEEGRMPAAPIVIAFVLVVVVIMALSIGL